MTIRNIIASSLLAISFCPILSACDRDDGADDRADDTNKGIMLCIKNNGLNNTYMISNFAGEIPIFMESNRHKSVRPTLYRYYDLERRTVTKSGPRTSYGTLPYDQLPEPERIKMDIIEQCIRQAGTPTFGLR